ncbi:putative ribosomal protein S4.e, cytosolic [Mycena leptocephala]|nr:putative ribosomal protein S4.e, cytosolic [Mycena leptocephala]
MGRAGAIFHREKHISGFDVVHVKDSLDRDQHLRHWRGQQAVDIAAQLARAKARSSTISEERDLKRKLVAEQ